MTKEEREAWTEYLEAVQEYFNKERRTKMGIEDYIRDIIRQKVNERVGQEMSVLSRSVDRRIRDAVREEVKKRFYSIMYPNRVQCYGVDEDDIERFRDYCEKESHEARAGSSWDVKEDEQLRGEMMRAISRIAMAHARTTGSIKSRLRKQAEDFGSKPLI